MATTPCPRRRTNILIGWLGDLTGPTASAQTPNHDGIQAYFDYVNSQGGVLGRELQLIAEDDQYNSETLVSNFKTLVDDRRVLALNHVGLTQVVFADVEAAVVPLVGPPQTIDQALENPYMFNLLAHYGEEADGRRPDGRPDRFSRGAPGSRRAARGSVG